MNTILLVGLWLTVLTGLSGTIFTICTIPDGVKWEHKLGLVIRLLTHSVGLAAMFILI